MRVRRWGTSGSSKATLNWTRNRLAHRGNQGLAPTGSFAMVDIREHTRRLGLMWGEPIGGGRAHTGSLRTGACKNQTFGPHFPD